MSLTAAIKNQLTNQIEELFLARRRLQGKSEDNSGLVDIQIAGDHPATEDWSGQDLWVVIETNLDT